MAAPIATTDDTPLRADAARNRERILEAAEAVFIERGADASLEDIAKRAKVGIGTLYRRFPNREALLAATSDDRLIALVEASRASDDTRTPDEAIRAYVVALVTHATHYRGLAASLGAVLHSGTPGCHASRGEGQRLLARAQDAGIVRKDVDIDDIVCMVTAISLAIEQDPAAASRVDHRVDLFLGGIGAV
jgi:AcrR family transcriptional regulator